MSASGNKTRKEIENDIRRATAEMNERIAEYRESGRSIKPFEATIDYLKGVAGVGGGYRGEIGYGFRGKTKARLQAQLTALKRILAFDLYTKKGKKHYKKDRYGKSQKTFEARYGSMTATEFEGLYDTFDVLRNYLADFGYEAVGTSIAQKYQETNAEGKRKFIDYVIKAKKAARGATTEDLIDTLTTIMKNDGVL